MANRESGANRKVKKLARPYSHKVTRNGVECSRHTSVELALKAARRLQAMSNGKLPPNTFKVEPVGDGEYLLNVRVLSSDTEAKR